MDMSHNLSALGWLGLALFVPALVGGVIGNIKLHHLLARRGIRVPFLLAGVTLVVYPLFRPAEDPAETDRIAWLTLGAWVLVAAVAAGLGPHMWPSP
jgi:hypothetical protein